MISVFMFVISSSGFGIINKYKMDILCQVSRGPINSVLEDITYELFQSPNKTWGYNILINGKLKIHQPNIPGIPGESGFKSKLSALKTAELAIKKIKQGLMPPTISTEELKKLNAID
ncbi:MAG: DUF4907 domain-containing protein [Cytophagales bacterium]|nr:DUF4907 domain-containing protein [Cytophagales bacterium]